MTIYADVFVIVNLYIDFLLLWCVGKFLGLPAKGWRLAAGGLAGALCAVPVLFPLPGWLSFLSGVLGALAAAGAAFWPLSWQRLLAAWLSLWVFSFLLAGFFLFLTRFFAPSHMAVLGHALYFDLSLPLLFFFSCGAYGLFWVFRRLFPRDRASLRLYTLVLEHRGHRVELTAKADSGNGLREPFSGLPVVVCTAKAIGDAAPPAVLNFLEGGASPAGSSPAGSGEGLRLVPFSSVGGAGVLPAFRPDSLTEKGTGRPLACYMAVCGQALSAGTFEALFNPDLFPEG